MLPSSSYPALPANHFLSLAPSFAPSLSNPASASLAPSTSSTASADFEVDVRTGFLPAEPPLRILPGAYAQWERLLSEAKGGAVRIGGEGEVREVAERWRRELRSMPPLVLPPEHLTAPIIRRAAVTLTFLLHFYVHSHPPPTADISIPLSISLPLNQVSSLLGLPPILTYATTVLYNVVAANPKAAFHPTSNLPVDVLETFTGLESERQFYLVSSLVELHGVKALSIMRSALDEAFVGDALALRRISGYLRALAGAIADIDAVMRGMRKSGCDPEEFYWVIRPWFRGSDGEGPGGLGWLFEGAGEDRRGERKIVSGPSAGQSSLVHSLDIFLGVDHKPTPPSSSAAAEHPPPSSDSTFMGRMLQYMPGPHRRFLRHLQTASPTIRDLVLENLNFGDGELARSYDLAVTAMGKFRDGHMIIVTQYIIQQARRPPPAHLVPPPTTTVPAPSPYQLGGDKLLPPTASTSIELPDEPDLEESDDKPQVRGTGGTALAGFLKGTKANTVRALVGGSASAK